MIWLRRVVFFLFLGLYLVFCPILIAYALGYLFRPGAGPQILRTGLISVATAPAGARVFLGRSRYAETTPTLLRDLLPGEYSVTLARSGYRPWTRRVQVEAGKAVALERVVLLPFRSEPEELLAEPLERLTPPGEGRCLLLADGPRLQDHFLYRWSQGESRPLSMNRASALAGGRVLSAFTVPGSPSFLLRVRAGPPNGWLWVDSTAEAAHDMGDLPGGERGEIGWDPADESVLFILEDGTLSRVGTSSGEILPRFAEGIRGFGFLRGRIYLLEGEGRVRRTDLDGESEEILLGDTERGRALFGGGGGFQIEVLSEETLLFLGEDGELLSNHLPYRLVDRGVKGILSDPDRERALIWQRGRVGIVSFAEEDTTPQEGIFPRGPAVRWVNTGGGTPEQGFWLFDGSHVLFRDGTDVFLLDLESPGENRPVEIVQVKRGSSVFYSDETGELFFLDRAGGRLCRLRVLRRGAE